MDADLGTDLGTDLDPEAAPARARDLAERSVAALRTDDAVARDLGIELLEVGPGAARVRMSVRPTMTNGLRTTHGGYVFVLADTAFAYACNSRGRTTVAAGCDIAFLEPTGAGDVLEAVATERALRGRSGIYDVSVLRGDRVVAEFRGRSRALGPPPP
ncbi:hydroxyphenylacetyl-CoA thioesterase PaaI [Kineococcus sp. SYSU DK002]|uniref:hydroxyphenylacetyl-CoA thioesterase PaaI n=1 Tax=Kineococcus sp. SYSU DK002 TaxID=3383123 RepID=UPI003D7DB942